MKILFIGDVFGEIGREMVNDYLHRLVKDKEIDFVIANVENTSHGKGLLKRHYDELSFQGIQAMTMGNHTFDKKVRVTNVLGVAFMDSRNSNPFDVIDDYLDLQQDIHIIDFHGETTSEKIAFAHYVKDKVNGAILGTHTHVQTADEKIIDGKVAFISDVGMTGPYMSAIGCDLDAIVTRLRGFGAPFIVAKSSGQLSGVIITFEENRPVEIERILINQDHPYN